MAIDTRNRRASCLLFDLPFANVWPDADGSLAAQADRQQMAWKYPGILAGAGATLLPRLTLLGAGCWLLWVLLR